ncbi:MAG: hypothetical protein INH41_03415 [Myxococcaceae bacterium]|jgi:hypothetical protein|nr:hypothetical protein [Myxococcaceae bacterium]MCA3011428.1 hypothetical protein [Myxococcaceae bacterium]
MAGETERIIETLSRDHLDPLLAELAARAELDDGRRRAFLAWADMMRERFLSPPAPGLAGLREQLEVVRREFRAVNAGVAASWLARGTIDEELVCRRSLLGALIDRVAPHVGGEGSSGRVVKAAA